MKILLLSYRPPGPPDKTSHGIYKRLAVMVDAMCQMGRVEALFFRNDDRDGSDVNALMRYCHDLWGDRVNARFCRVEKAPFASAYEAYVEPIFNIRSQFRHLTGAEPLAAIRYVMEDVKPDMVFAHRLESLIALNAAGVDAPRVVMDLDDIEHRSFWRLTASPPWWPGKVASLLQYPLLAFSEAGAMRRIAASLVCSDTDQHYLQRIWRLENIHVVPNSVTFPARVDMLPKAQNLLFIGSFTYLPNVRAVEILMASVWPAIHAQLPEARLLIVGNGSRELGARYPAAVGVEWLGFIRDLAGLYRDVRIAVCPITMGGGTRIKIIEAAAYGRPVVSTTIGAEGLSFRTADMGGIGPLNDSSEEIVLRDDPLAFARACMNLLIDFDRCARIGRAARARAESQYSRQAVVEQVRSLISQTVG
jgi:glycosyltransferase involved in cell wall biosynthesis